MIWEMVPVQQIKLKQLQVKTKVLLSLEGFHITQILFTHIAQVVTLVII